ncbi:MAG: hypothetical protein A2504_10630 [Bdellovibrionales bacterium RIFOXYD12_FULL_39_22]|nr:MAG: hypothetical protein A2385_14265 [Bdellovibrionales bacterium RIFOXYB1_FULL_39_21]OFZ40399.1 MAG: hypothetical protein A2485_02955 [Bdellovibrionales bacterium RIFOXYC12_FULL_39_17]OFZ49648.1 MAG: hypothetical protein A2404_09415 [Bdellovibrionales bacterium RIFOXYC1_FULL_39_130]OFZ77318.1 MAG: hypothetical protein A2560_06080 [Bdellovibrionales bacterium RIFOXYD1_FULL_39_84]OFZ95973.1 MAG: hypothetical protein A2504_10630 [Bdellovibrionales bacterium RIFOXYD12_FULL_39_22]HLE11234.1 hy
MAAKKIVIAASSIVLAIIFLATIGSGYFFLKSQVSPKKVEKVIVRGLKSLFPQALVEIGKVEVSYSDDVDVRIEKMRVYLKNNGNEIDLFAASNLRSEISILSILSTNAEAEVVVDNPVITYRELDQQQSNWKLARGNKANSNNNDKNSLLIPGALARASINLRLKNLSINYALKNHSHGVLSLANCAVKNISLSSESAFKVESKVSLALSNEKNLFFDSLIIGQFNLSDLVNNGTISPVIVIRPSNIFWRGQPLIINEPVINLKATIDQHGAISGELSTTVAEKNRLRFKYNINDELTTLSDIDLELYLSEIEEMFGTKWTIADAALSKINLRGKLELGDNIFNPELNLALSPPLKWKYLTAYGDLSVEGSYLGDKIEIKAQNKTPSGNVDLSISAITKQDLLNNKLKLSPLKVSLLFDRLTLEKNAVSRFFYASSAGKKSPLSFHPKSRFLLPPSEISLSSRNLKLEGEEFQFAGKILITPSDISIPSLDFKMQNGSGKLKSTIAWKTSKESKKVEVEHKVDLSLNNIPVKTFNAFLPPSFDVLEGMAKGTIKGNIITSTGHRPKINFDYKLTLRDGKIKGVEIKSKFDKLFASSPFLKDKNNRQLIVDEHFKTLTAEGFLQKDLLNLKKILIIGKNSNYEVTGKTIIKNSPLVNNVVDLFFHDKSGIIGDIILPIRFTGPGLTLEADKAYIEKEIQTILQKRYKILYKKK